MIGLELSGNMASEEPNDIVGELPSYTQAPPPPPPPLPPRYQETRYTTACTLSTPHFAPRSCPIELFVHI